MLGIERPLPAVLKAETKSPLRKLRQETTIRTEKRMSTGIYGKHSKSGQGRTQEIETHGAQKSESGEAEEAPRLRPRIEEAKSEEAGSRPIEAVRQLWIDQLAFGRTVLGCANTARPIASCEAEG
jgi:hypothetical protein